MRRQDINAKQLSSAILNFSILQGSEGGGKKMLNFDQFGFWNKTRLEISPRKKNSHLEIKLKYFKKKKKNFFDFKIGGGEKIQIFECNSALNYSSERKFHLRRLDFNIKKHFR